jgi:hypothetical protein
MDSNVIHLVRAKVKKSSGLGDFLIVEYGDKSSNEVYFCEFYKIETSAKGVVTDTTSPDLPQKTVARHRINYLLARMGSERFTIKSIEMQDRGKSVVFSIDQSAKHEYSITFENPGSKNPNRKAVPWHGGIIWQLTFTKKYEPHWASRFYELSSTSQAKDQ